MTDKSPVEAIVEELRKLGTDLGSLNPASNLGGTFWTNTGDFIHHLADRIEAEMVPRPAEAIASSVLVTNADELREAVADSVFLQLAPGVYDLEGRSLRIVDRTHLTIWGQGQVTLQSGEDEATRLANKILMPAVWYPDSDTRDEKIAEAAQMIREYGARKYHEGVGKSVTMLDRLTEEGGAVRPTKP
jgi:hypothetical protein